MELAHIEIRLSDWTKALSELQGVSSTTMTMVLVTAGLAETLNNVYVLCTLCVCVCVCVKLFLTHSLCPTQ